MPTYAILAEIKILLAQVKLNTVKLPIVDPPRKGHNINDLPTRDTARGPKNYLPYIVSIH